MSSIQYALPSRACVRPMEQLEAYEARGASLQTIAFGGSITTTAADALEVIISPGTAERIVPPREAVTPIIARAPMRVRPHKDEFASAFPVNSRRTLGVVNRMPPESVWAAPPSLRASEPAPRQARASMAKTGSLSTLPHASERFPASPPPMAFTSPTTPAVSSSLAVAQPSEPRRQTVRRLRPANSDEQRRWSPSFASDEQRRWSPSFANVPTLRRVSSGLQTSPRLQESLEGCHSSSAIGFRVLQRPESPEGRHSSAAVGVRVLQRPESPEGRQSPMAVGVRVLQRPVSPERHRSPVVLQRPVSPEVRCSSVATGVPVVQRPVSPEGRCSSAAVGIPVLQRVQSSLLTATPRRPLSSEAQQISLTPGTELRRVQSGLLTSSPRRQANSDAQPQLKTVATMPVLQRTSAGFSTSRAQASQRNDRSTSARTERIESARISDRFSSTRTPEPVGSSRRTLSAGSTKASEHIGSMRVLPEASRLAVCQEMSPKSEGVVAISWSLNWTMSIGEDFDNINFAVPILVMDRNVYSSVHTVIDGLNRGTIRCTEGLCLAYSQSCNSWYLLYRNGRKDLAMSAMRTSDTILPSLVFQAAAGQGGNLTQPWLDLGLGSSTPQMQPELGPGVVLRFDDCTCKVVQPLGMGSFGAVWVAERLDGGVGELAIKEIYCSSQAELSGASYEGKLIQILTQARARERAVSSPTVSPPTTRNAYRQTHQFDDFADRGHAVDEDTSSEATLDGHALHADALDRIPAFVAVQTKSLGPNAWRVRLAMTKVPGVPLDRYLEWHKEQSSYLYNHETSATQCQRFSEACQFAKQLIEQLAPTFVQISTHAYHRDINAFNVLVDGGAGTPPRFGIVDFGLAVDGVSWRGADVSPSSWHLVDIGGDCRYWPMSAWLQFECGWQELLKHPLLAAEYQVKLDFHALGITALQALAAMSPSEPTPPMQADAAGLEAAQAEEGLPQEVWTLRRAWDEYWKDVTKFWERLLACFRQNGDQYALKGECIHEGVHNIVGADLGKLREALREVYELACRCSTSAGLAGSGPLFAALLELISAGGSCGVVEGGVVEGPRPLTWQAVCSIIGSDKEPQQSILEAGTGDFSMQTTLPPPD